MCHTLNIDQQVDHGSIALDKLPEVAYSFYCNCCMVFNRSNTSSNETAYEVSVLVVSIISTISTSITIALIYKMNITGYIKLILAMSWYQLIYDLSYFTDGNDVGNYPVMYLSALGQTIGGLGSSIISNWIAYAVFYIIVYQRSFDIMKYYNKIFISSIIIMLPIVLLYSIGDIPENAHPQFEFAAGVIYFTVRVVSILINFLLVLFMLFMNYRKRSKRAVPTVAEQAINTLSKRMMYYPIIQVNSFIYALFRICYAFHHSH